MIERVKRYPARLQAAVTAAVALGTSFGLAFTAEQTGALVAYSAALIALFVEKPGANKS